MSDKRTQTRKRILSEAGRALFARGRWSLASAK